MTVAGSFIVTYREDPDARPGPMEWVAIDFPGDHIDVGILPDLARLVDTGLVRILDLLIVHRDADGAVTASEIHTLDPPDLEPFDLLTGEALGLLNLDDIETAGRELDLDSTALIVVWENIWAATFAEAVRGRHGTLLTHNRIPHDNAVAALHVSTQHTDQEQS